jgi:DNA helicase-2/ATP-dependent DNA helicase PcrA
VRRVLGIDCEVRASVASAASSASSAQGAWAGAEQLDAFADVVAGYAERTSATDASAATSVPGLLAYLDAAEMVENGLPPAPVVVARGACPGAHRALREGLGMAGGGGCTPVGRNISVDRIA